MLRGCAAREWSFSSVASQSCVIGVAFALGKSEVEALAFHVEEGLLFLSLPLIAGVFLVMGKRELGSVLDRPFVGDFTREGL